MSSASTGRPVPRARGPPTLSAISRSTPASSRGRSARSADSIAESSPPRSRNHFIVASPWDGAPVTGNTAPASRFVTARSERAIARGRIRRVTAVSWKVIEHGWSVRSSDREDIGVVFMVVGDENEDIFDGLAITHHKGFAVHNYGDL